MPAGVLHAYVAGLGVEIMAASDNVLRGGLTPKHIDVQELLSLVDFPARRAALPASRATGDGAEVFAPGIADFALGHLAGGEAAELDLRGVAIALGGLRVADADGCVGRHRDAGTGRAALVTADESPLSSDGAGEVFVAMRGPERDTPGAP